jgi:eukaryotic-like serine/threonine-protein kinase
MLEWVRTAPRGYWSGAEVNRVQWQRPYVAFRPPSPPLPTRFRVGGLLGRGVGTEVYSAHDQVLDRPVAVKLFPADLDPTACRRVADEARALDRLDHRCLVSVFDGGVHRSRPYLVMQLIRGQSLGARLRGGALPVELAVTMMALLADGLAHVHSRGVVHRDVKPSNVLLDRQSIPYLGDFGIALLSDQSRVTGAHEIVGTPAYLAPEQVYGGPLGPAVDIYALGLVLLECLTGKREYTDDNRLKAALARLDRPPRIPTDLSAPLAGLLRAMTAVEPERRPTAELCVEALRAVLYDLTNTRDQTRDQSAEPTRRMRANQPAMSLVPSRLANTGRPRSRET